MNSLIFLYPQSSNISSLSSLTVEDIISLSPEKTEAISTECPHTLIITISYVYQHWHIYSAFLLLYGLSMLIVKAMSPHSSLLKAVTFLRSLLHQLSHCCWIILFGIQTCYCFANLYKQQPQITITITTTKLLLSLPPEITSYFCFLSQQHNTSELLFIFSLEFFFLFSLQ